MSYVKNYADEVERFCIKRNLPYVWINEYQIRVHGCLDIWPKRMKFHHIPTQTRGVCTVEQIPSIVRGGAR